MNLEKLSVESAKKDSTVHFFPCEIKYNGEAEVDRYFNTSVKKCEGEDGGKYMYRSIGVCHRIPDFLSQALVS